MKYSIIKIVCLAGALLLMMTIGLIERLQKLDEFLEPVPYCEYSEYGGFPVVDKLTFNPYKPNRTNQSIANQYYNNNVYPLPNSLFEYNLFSNSFHQNLTSNKQANNTSVYTWKSSPKLSHQNNNNQAADNLLWSMSIHQNLMTNNYTPFGYRKNDFNFWIKQTSPDGGGGLLSPGATNDDFGAPFGGGLVSPDDDDDDLGNPLPVGDGMCFMLMLCCVYLMKKLRVNPIRLIYSK